MVRVKGLDSRGGRNPRLVAGGRNCPPDSFSVPPLFKSSRLQDQKNRIPDWVSCFFGASGDTELFEKPSKINGFWAVGQ